MIILVDNVDVHVGRCLKSEAQFVAGSHAVAGGYGDVTSVDNFQERTS